MKMSKLFHCWVTIPYGPPHFLADKGVADYTHSPMSNLVSLFLILKLQRLVSSYTARTRKYCKNKAQIGPV